MRFFLAVLLAIPAQILAPIAGDVHHSVGGGPVFIGSGTTGTTASCQGSTTSCPVTYSPTAGNQLIVLVIYSSAHATTSVSDNGATSGCTYSTLFSATSTNGGNNFFVAYKCASAKASTTVITANGGGESMVVTEWTGIGPTLDVSNLTVNLTSGTTAFTSGNITTTVAADVVIGMHYDVTTNNAGWAGSGGFIALPNVNAFNGNGFSGTYKILSATATIAATGTTTGSDACFNIVFSVH